MRTKATLLCALWVGTAHADILPPDLTNQILTTGEYLQSEQYDQRIEGAEVTSDKMIRLANRVDESLIRLDGQLYLCSNYWELVEGGATPSPETWRMTVSICHQ
jgi:hypothetical protein